MFSFDRFLGLGDITASFSVQLRCFSAPFFPKYDSQKINELNYGGKILLPNSCLDSLVRRHIQWPMLFKLTNPNPERQKSTHAGVLEFLAEEGKCYLPSWMMSQLSLIEGELILVEYKSLPPATYAKFKPMSTDFYHVTNPRAMLEVELRKFACLSKGDIIAVQYNEQIFEFKVMDLKPQNAVTIIECDINIEFDTAEGYVEPTLPTKNKNETSTSQESGQINNKNDAGTAIPDENVFKPFTGSGQRLDGKKSRNISSSGVGLSTKQSTSTQREENMPQGSLRTAIIVDENYKPGELHFVRTEYKNRCTLEKLAQQKDVDEVSGVKPFSGKGQSIRDRF